MTTQDRMEWGHWCHDQTPSTLPTTTPRCPDCGALDLLSATTNTSSTDDAITTERVTPQ